MTLESRVFINADSLLMLMFTFCTGGRGLLNKHMILIRDQIPDQTLRTLEVRRDEIIPGLLG